MAQTLLETLNSATSLLKEKNLPNPRSTSELFLSSILNLKRVDLYLNREKILSEKEKDKLFFYLKERISGKPIQYIIKNTGFYGLEFKTDPRAMIPRPETETLVNEVIQHFIKKESEPIKIIDIGTGSGVIAITLAYELKNSFVYATDISKDALELALENAKIFKVEKRVKFVLGDFFDPLKNKNLVDFFDCIVSNPPYVKDSDYKNLDKEIKDFEPEIAFLCGDDGINFHKKIAKEGVKYLKKGGLLVLEIALGNAEKLLEFLSSSSLYNQIRIVKDLAGIRRVVSGLRS